MGQPTQQKDEFELFYDYIKQRFPNANFVASCFDTVAEVDNKILSSADQILYHDRYVADNLVNGSWMLKYDFDDYFLITKKEGKQHIYYCDVIDELIRQGFNRSNCDYQFMESIELETSPRNNNSLPVYSSFWGS